MKTIWYRVTRLLHPITLAVILVGVAGFLVGLIVAVERQDAAVVAPPVVAPPVVTPGVEVAQAGRIAELETSLARRETELGELQNEVARLRAQPAPPPVDNAAGSRIAGLEAALAESSAELNSLQGEVVALSGKLAEAIQTRDDLRTQNDRARRDGENERLALEKTIADLRGRLEAAEQRARPQAPLGVARDDSPPTEQPAVSAPVEPEPAVAAPEPPTPTPSPAAEVSTPTQPAPAPPAPPAPSAAEPSETETQSDAVPATAGPITRGIAAYQAAEYEKAYEIWLPQALKGSTRAQFYVGALYFEGRGVPEDRVLSYMWLRAATKEDDPGAIKLLDRVRGGMTGPELAEAETRIASGETIPDR
jgi:hypothetical protein